MAEQPEKNPIDLSKILLPKKESPGDSVDSAQRVNAGALFAQEQAAAANGPSPDGTQPTAPAPQAPEPTEEPSTRPLQTFQSDIESLVQKGGVSTVSIAAAEAMRRGKTKEPEPVTESAPRPWRKWIYMGVGVVLVLAAGGLIAYALLRPTTVPVTPTGAHAAIIFVDEAYVVPVTGPRANAMITLDSARKLVDIPLGLIARLVPAPPTPTGQNTTAYSAEDFLSLIAPEVPVELLRTLEPEFLLGVHSYDENQALLILRVDSYEVAYRAMLEWETTLYAELLPLFTRKPPVRVGNAPVVVVATTTASTTATTTASTTTPTPAPVESVINTDFVDKIVENRDARVLQNSNGDILLMWTFLDRDTIVVATNDATLREVITRRAQAPVLTLPQ